MAIKGFIVHDRESGAYALTDSGRAALLAILGDAGACPQYGTGNQRLGPALPSDSYTGNGGVCLTAALPRPGEGGRQSESGVMRTDIKVLYCFHQNNDGSQCEVAHTSPSIRPSKSPADWY